MECTMRIISTSLAALFLGFSATASIAGKVETFYSPSGEQLAVIKCSSNPNKCFKQATKSCKGQYQVVDSESHAGGLLADLLPGPVTWYSMMVRCGNSDGKMPAFPFRGQSYNPPSYVQCSAFGGSILCVGN